MYDREYGVIALMKEESVVEIGKLEQELIGDVWTSPALGESMRMLCDVCNGRFAGTEDERRAGQFLLDQMQSYGLENVHAEAFEMRGWVRGNAHLALLGPDGEQELPCLALAGSPPGELEAAVIDVGQGAPADFERLGEAVAGKAVLAHARGPHRLEKYAQAIATGARAFLFTNARPGMLIPAGSVGLGEPEKELPSLGLSLETGTYLQRLLARAAQGVEEPLRVKISVGGGPEQVTARNIVGELPGTDPEAGWIVVCGHYDGHDIAQGAQDNATGTAVVLEAARVLSGLRTHLKAGVRFVLFSGEEMGMYGSEAYVRDHPGQLDQIRAVFNADIVGMAAPLRLMVQNSPGLASYLRGLPLAELDAEVNDSHLVPYSDHFHFTLAGVASLMAVTSSPGEGRGWGHTAADTLDKIELRELRQAAATTARILLYMATSPESLPGERTSPEEVQKALKAAGLEEPMRVRGAWPF
jgi:aminopeptidase YwaD